MGEALNTLITTHSPSSGSSPLLPTDLRSLLDAKTPVQSQHPLGFHNTTVNDKDISLSTPYEPDRTRIIIRILIWFPGPSLAHKCSRIRKVNQHTEPSTSAFCRFRLPPWPATPISVQSTAPSTPKQGQHPRPQDGCFAVVDHAKYS